MRGFGGANKLANQQIDQQRRDANRAASSERQAFKASLAPAELARRKKIYRKIMSITTIVAIAMISIGVLVDKQEQSNDIFTVPFVLINLGFWGFIVTFAGVREYLWSPPPEVGGAPPR